MSDLPNTKEVQKFFDWLAEEYNLNAEEAFSIIYYLQEKIKPQVISDCLERCINCDSIYDSHECGHHISEDSLNEQWYKDNGIPQEEIKKHFGDMFCSCDCELNHFAVSAWADEQ